MPDSDAAAAAAASATDKFLSFPGSVTGATVAVPDFSLFVIRSVALSAVSDTSVFMSAFTFGQSKKFYQNTKPKLFHTFKKRKYVASKH